MTLQVSRERMREQGISPDDPNFVLDESIIDDYLDPIIEPLTREPSPLPSKIKVPKPRPRRPKPTADAALLDGDLPKKEKIGGRFQTEDPGPKQKRAVPKDSKVSDVIGGLVTS